MSRFIALLVRRLPRSFGQAVVGLTLLCLSSAVFAQDFVWLEGEAPASCNVKPAVTRPGHKEFLSGQQWLQIAIDANKVEKETPAEGVLIQYKFDIKKAGDYEIWNRVGYEFDRSPFSWRVDGGDWSAVPPDQLTTDLMELDAQTEIAWLKMGVKTLSPGAHTLDIQLPRTKDAKGQAARILYASDALCLSAGAFTPNAQYKPGEARNAPEDKEAADKVFSLPFAFLPGERAVAPLNGLWQICRDDEQTPGETAAPIAALPKNPIWTGIAVPGDKNTLRPDLLLAHRLWYRTKVHVPDTLAGRSFSLVFPQNDLNTTVYVNGTLCGFDKNPYARFAIDVTKAVKPGDNEIWVGLRDAWYGYSANPKNPMKLRRKLDLPFEATQQKQQDLAYPIWGAFQSGILATPQLVVAGPVYTEDVFCRPSVSKKLLAVDVTLHNSSPNAVSGEVACQVMDPAINAVEKALPVQPFTLAAGAEQTFTISIPWQTPRLWWPDTPEWYLLHTIVRVDGKPVDLLNTPFGFREWTTDGKNLKLNGVVMHLWSDDTLTADPHSWLGAYRDTNQRMARFGGPDWLGLPPDAALELFDRNGVVVRRQGMLDGSATGYNVLETDPDLKKQSRSDLKMDLIANWRDQLVAQVQGERNHPSIMLWSLENEWLSTNVLKLARTHLAPFIAEERKTAQAVLKVDPTRPVLSDGGGASADGDQPVYDNHPLFDAANFRRYPALAYQPNPEGGGHERWVWDQRLPRFIGKDFDVHTLDPGLLAAFGGPEALHEGDARAHAAGTVADMLAEGYRWAGFAAWDLYVGPKDVSGGYHSTAYAPRAVLCRQWDWTFGSGQKVPRTLTIFNDTRSADPISFTWALRVNGKQIAMQNTGHHVAPGAKETFDITLTMPNVDSRQEGQLTLTLSVGGEQVFQDVKAVSILNPAAKRASLTARSLLVYDPNGAVRAFLRERGIPFTSLHGLDTLPAGGKVLIVGPDALDLPTSRSSKLAAYAANGRTVIVLEQNHPLSGKALPIPMETTTHTGRIAFNNDSDDPALRGLQHKDFFTWGPDEVVYKNAYVTPKSGVRSLVDCDLGLQDTALAVVPDGKGTLLLCQLVVGEKLAGNAVAQQLLLNLLAPRQ
ncbi:MAG TPA: glycoside hydrolase family 2 TIM barrel-domain containing protein [Chthonomonadaceae bacterium]|nr:glycoside hydrolase family 2 TIM barrel-domain containing protein [Chthonomonadaceae bacterium]